MQVAEHHRKAQVATNRPSYREARWEKAVKVYTVNQESKYLLVQNVHALGVTQELLQLFSLYGDIQEYRVLDEYPCEPYTDVYWVKFVDISSARVAKRKLDNKSFFGKNLHVSYAPEFESVEETREKLQQRKAIIAQKTQEACIKAQHEKRIKSQKKNKEELDKTKEDSSASVVVAECPPQLGQSKESDVRVPIQIPINFDEPIPHSSTQLPSSQHVSTAPLLQQPRQSGERGMQAALPLTYHQAPPLPLPTHPQAPPLPPPSIHGLPTPQYPSQSSHSVMGGAVPPCLPLSRETVQCHASVPSQFHDQHTTATRSERSRGPKRPRARTSDDVNKRDRGNSIRETTRGLTTAQRVSAFLSDSDGISSISTTKAIDREPLAGKKRAAHQEPGSSGGESQREVGRTAMAEQRDSSDTKLPVPSESYFPVQTLPPLQSGSKSIDTSIQAVRSKMNKVWDEAVHQPHTQRSKKPKKRKRI